MNEKQRRDLDVISRIDEEIIEKNTQKRIALFGKRKRNKNIKWIIPTSAAAVLVAIMVPLLLMLLIKQVPVYEGMTVLENYNGISSASIEPERRGNGFEFLSDKKDNNGNNGNNGDNGNHNGQNKKPVDEIIEEDTSISLEIPEQKMYYANPGQDIYINVHISNPDSFEILSFTLNGKKYSSYMFEDGSDMENLILKVNVGDAKGVVEYTIDAIKYVDGTDIKDVVMKGDKTIKVGVYSAGIQPTTTIDNEIIGINDVNLNITLSDDYKLIERSGGMVFAGVYTEDGIVAYKKLSVGENEITFEGLDTYTSYRYGVAAYYDALDGNGMDVKILFQKEFTTQSVVSPDNVQIDQTSIRFGLKFSEVFESKKLSSMVLYHGDDKVKDFDVSVDLEEQIFEATELLSNNVYKLIITYENEKDTETAEFILTTLKKAEPTFTINDLTSDAYTVNGSYDQTNVDNTLISYTVSIFKGNELVKENVDKKIAFDSLDCYTDYTVKITYTFDVNGGKGVQTKTVERSITTLPFVDVKALLVRNPTLFEGDVCYIQANIDNPLNATVTHVTINGKEHAVLSASTSESLFVEMICEGLGGSVTLSVEKIKIKLDGKTYVITPTTVCESTMFVNGVFDVIDVEITNKDGEAIYWLFPGVKHYIKIRANNPTGYNVTDISIDGYTLEVNEADRITDNEYLIDTEGVPLWHISDITISYENQYVSKTVTSSISNNIVLKLSSNETRYVSSVDDLKNMQGTSYYYELTNDIDLSGINWVPVEFNGVLNGNGYSIKNMTYIGEIPETGMGLFSTLSGVVCNLTVDNAFVMSSSKGEYYDNSHALIAENNDGVVLNCTINSSSIISMVDGNIAGFVGHNTGLIRGCVNNADISGRRASGIVGDIYGYSRVDRCVNNGNITASRHACGIVESEQTSGCYIKNCINNGSITSELTACAISIVPRTPTIDCLNTGTVKGGVSAGVGGENKGCLNIGDIAGDNDSPAYYSYDADSKNVVRTICTVEQLNSKEFYTETLGWDEEIWDFSELDFENGKYPKLK